MFEKFIKVGLTGGFGTGKTTVAGMFKKLGARVVDADALAHRLLKKGTEQYYQVIDVFGEKMVDKSGRILRRRIAQKVFGHPRSLAQLNRILHPAVLKMMKEKLNRGRKPVCVAVVPLLYEVGLEDWFDYIIVVNASRQNVSRRMAADRKMSKLEIEKRQQAQLPLIKKIRKSDFIINNNGSLFWTRSQVKAILKTLFDRLII